MPRSSVDYCIWRRDRIVRVAMRLCHFSPRRGGHRDCIPRLVQFGFEGADYEVTLSSRNYVNAFRKPLTPCIEYAREAGRPRPALGQCRRTAGAEQLGP